MSKWSIIQLHLILYVIRPVTSKPKNVEVEEPKSKDVQTQWDKSCTSVARNPLKLCCTQIHYHLHTGLPHSTFHLSAQNLLPLYSGSFQLDPIDQLLMTVIKLKLNLLQEYLTERFSVCQSGASRILVYWIDVMEKQMRSYILWLPKETTVETLPQCFKEHYPGTSCIIDRGEQKTELATFWCDVP